jgi:protein gp37
MWRETMDKTKIDWAESSWNPITGCYHKCPYCYARGITNRFRSRAGYELVDNGSVEKETKNGTIIEMSEQAYFINGSSETVRCAYPHGFIPTFHKYRLDEYKDKTRPRNIFVGSMSDIFGAWVPDEWIEQIFEACKAAPQHNYMFLTKNPKRYIELQSSGKLPHDDNLWFGTTANTGTSPYMWKYGNGGFHTFLSIEPILEDFGEFAGEVPPEWIIVGAETGNRKEKVVPEKSWIDNIVIQCREHNIPIFMKESLRALYGDSLIQEFPKGLRRE